MALWLREWRHNACLMRPVTAILVLLVCLLSLAVFVVRFPTIVLGWLIFPILSRLYWVVEFWYPTSLGKFCHVTLVRWVQRTSRLQKGDPENDACQGLHSRALETRIEVVPGRVYIHVIPQWLDNLGYLVVCLPPKQSASTSQNTGSPKRPSNSDSSSKSSNSSSPTRPQTETTPLGESLTIDPHGNTPIVAFLVDVGDADVVVKHVRRIRQHYYQDAPLHVQSILSTHKHHDHTAGNIDLCRHSDWARHDDQRIQHVFGGAADAVPGCNYPLANGDKLPLPHCGLNDMNDVVEVEAVATPAHTRGSLTYILRPLSAPTTATVAPPICLFTGDTIFSGGGGVPFEADLDPNQDSTTAAAKMTAHSYIRASAAANAMERCLAEVLFRSTPTFVDSESSSSSASSCARLQVTSDHILLFPGHEYTNELLARQLAAPSTMSTNLESAKWKNMAPSAFFETVHQYYIALHRRNLPHSTGKLLTIPSTVTRERLVNPHLRSLKQRGTVVIAALKMWHRNFCRERVLHIADGPAFGATSASESTRPLLRTSDAAPGPQSAVRRTGASPNNEQEWNLTTADIGRSVFATVYAADLESIIDNLRRGQMDAATAADKLQILTLALDKPVIGRRPIPGTLPTSRNVYRGLLGLALLGSAPTALTMADSQPMKLPAPLVGPSSDGIRVSKRRLIAVLHWLGLLDDYDGQMIVAIVGQLWKETKEYMAKLVEEETALLLRKRDKPPRHAVERTDADKEVYKNDSTDVESVPETDDDVELGALKWVMYGIPVQRPKSWLSSFCMPCSSSNSDDTPSKLHPAGRSGMQRNGGELVRHDVFSCPLCCDATGRKELTHHIEQVNGYTHRVSSSVCTYAEADTLMDHESLSFIEVSPQAIDSLAPAHSS
jgi:glyoxylase-like metal-dependent hydrolase (beta-lactamase superfamily II)